MGPALCSTWIVLLRENVTIHPHAKDNGCPEIEGGYVTCASTLAQREPSCLHSKVPTLTTVPTKSVIKKQSGRGQEVCLQVLHLYPTTSTQAEHATSQSWLRIKRYTTGWSTSKTYTFRAQLLI